MTTIKSLTLAALLLAAAPGAAVASDADVLRLDPYRPARLTHLVDVRKLQIVDFPILLIEQLHCLLV